MLCITIICLTICENVSFIVYIYMVVTFLTPSVAGADTFFVLECFCVIVAVVRGGDVVGTVVVALHYCIRSCNVKYIDVMDITLLYYIMSCNVKYTDVMYITLLYCIKSCNVKYIDVMDITLLYCIRLCNVKYTDVM